jgi:hypothetical protein
MTRRSSVRAQAQEFYREMVEDDRARGSLSKDTPLPNPLPQGERGQAVPGEREQAVQQEGDSASLHAGGDNAPATQTDPPSLRAGETSLTARVRALYEGAAVPVREIAKLAGVSERTVYKYVEKHGWQKRYRVKPRGEAAAEVNRGRGWQPGPGFAPAKGAGGRFIRREDKDRPFAAGLKATDPRAQARAAAAAAEAERRAALAEADAQAERWGAENIRAIQMVNQARQDLDAYDAAQKKRKKPVAPSIRADLCERALLMSLKVALDWMEITVKAWEAAEISSLERWKERH